MNPPDRLPTSDEIDRRLRVVSELRNLCLSLGQARRTDTPPMVRQSESVEPTSEPDPSNGSIINT